MRSRLFGESTQLFHLVLPGGSRRLTSGSDFANQQYIGHRVRKLCLPWALGSFVVALLTLSALFPAAAQVKPVRRVLVFNDFGSVSSPGIAEMDREIFDGLQKSPYQVEFYNENLEVTLFSEGTSQRQIGEWYIRKYSGRRPDVIITVGPASLRFIQEMHEGPFKDTPVVFCGIMEIPAGLEANSRFTGAWSGVQTEKTMKSALRLQPGTRHVVVVGGVGSLDRQAEAIVRENLRGYESKFDFTYLTDLSMPNLLEQLKLLPSDTIVLHTAITQDADGNRFIDATQAVPMVAGAARAPVFVLDDVDLNNGAVGGDLLSWAATAHDAARSALRILNGEKPQDIPIVRSDNVYMFDWRALRSWGLKETNLPPGSIVRNRQPSLWESFRWYVIGGMTLILAEALLISGLLVQRAKRKRAEASLIIANERLAKDLIENTQITEALQKSETKFSKVFRLSPVAKTLTRLKDERCVDLNEAFEPLGGWRRDEVLGRTLAEIGIWANPDERLRFVEDLKRETHVRAHEAQFRTKSGEIRTVLRSSDLVEIDGELCGLTVIVDITERKLADEVVAGMSRKLLEAQEQERRRIGRELHDDINQRLALLSVEIDLMKEVSPGMYGELRSRMDEIGKRTSEISAVVQSLSHELHSSKLEYLGLVSAMKSFCKEFGAKHQVEIDFSSDGIPSDVPAEVSLCLFRVMQEGLHNALKHSGVRFFEVKMHGSPAEIRLTVRDLGRGFEIELAKDIPGLGLVSMQERVRLVKGTISITSKPQSGTEINVRVPLQAEVQKEQAKLAGA
jgi:PAS domain S-box-containing protein